jgi:uncharacterized protein YifN (PemK superfamily)
MYPVLNKGCRTDRLPKRKAMIINSAPEKYRRKPKIRKILMCPFESFQKNWPNAVLKEANKMRTIPIRLFLKEE